MVAYHSGSPGTTPMQGRLESINVSRGGVPKTPVPEAVVTELGLDGDRQRFPYHGGAERAVVLFSMETIRALQAEGHPIDVGTTGENLTISGLDWTRLVPGVELQIGGVRLAITKYALPCQTITRSFAAADVDRISHKLHAGWSRICARVIAGGVVRTGDPVVVSIGAPESAPATER